MKNRVSLEGYGEILAGRIARPYEKGTPRAKQGDEYWFFFFYKAFCIDFQREQVREKDRDRESKKERESEGKREKGWHQKREALHT